MGWPKCMCPGCCRIYHVTEPSEGEREAYTVGPSGQREAYTTEASGQQVVYTTDHNDQREVPKEEKPMSRLIVFLGSTRDGRNGTRVATHLVNLLKERKHAVTVFDPLKMPFELLRQPLHFMPDQSAAPQWLRDANAEIAAADGFVVVTPEYNCSLPPALVNMLDHFPPASFRHRPVGIACYSLGELTATRSVS
ncbi:hypothetical protein FJT64_023219 [Amphibalanus amphitrite]|uniref:NADPH-dependent FMN reductase-like domain-containing protein n=1 Tax=Amphibalanus amphitrite TaxID=1232801 RepID=A0A6A4WCN6_AMPAM|nr:hypothetical protein FJT64_023219 [Amphibalanus amphitrite]